MIWLTGDTHGLRDINKLSIMREYVQGRRRKDNYLMICGDFGGVWDQATLEEDLKPYRDLPLMVLFCDGNHENFDLLDQYPTEIWNGGKIHVIADNIYHLQRGQIFNIEGKTFLVIGGADSRDKAKRLEYEQRIGKKVWWQQEQICRADINKAIANLKRHGNRVDYMISHCASADVCEEMLSITGDERFRPTTSEKFLREICTDKTYHIGHKYCGHYHYDTAYENTTFLYRRIIAL